jgi:hypothetical protein
VTPQRHPGAIFKRAIERGNLFSAEMVARELGRLSLSDSLALTALAAQKDPGRRSRYAVRWLRRLLEEDPNLTLEEAQLAAAALAALGTHAHVGALATLSAMAERAARQGGRRWLPAVRSKKRLPVLDAHPIRSFSTRQRAPRTPTAPAPAIIRGDLPSRSRR